jgi:hypothetical protein
VLPAVQSLVSKLPIVSSLVQGSGALNTVTGVLDSASRYRQRHHRSSGCSGSRDRQSTVTVPGVSEPRRTAVVCESLLG